MMQLSVKNMEINLNLNGITTVIGPSNSGKTTFLKKLIHHVNNDDVYIDDVSIKEYDITFLKNNFVVVLDDNVFYTDNVAEELFFNLNRLGYNLKESLKKIESISNYFKIDNLLDERIERLRLEDRILIKILSYLIINPKLFGIDNLLCYLSKSKVKLLIEYIKENEITLVNVSSNAEDLSFSDYVIVMSNYKALMCVDAYTVLNGNSILPYIGIKLPFTVDLSNNLILYDVVSKIETDNRKLVDKIWK